MRYANYRFYEYAEQPAHGGNVVYTWRINHWTGGLNQYSSASQPVFDPNYAQVLPSGGATRDFGQYKVFGGGFTLAGLSLKSKAQYYPNTKMRWERISGCTSPQQRWLYGQGADWTIAPTVYATCR